MSDCRRVANLVAPGSSVALFCYRGLELPQTSSSGSLTLPRLSLFPVHGSMTPLLSCLSLYFRVLHEFVCERVTG